MKKNFYSLLILLVIISNSVLAQKKVIVIVHDTTSKRDTAVIKAIRDYNGGATFDLVELTAERGLINYAQYDTLNDLADVVIMGRSIPSGNITARRGIWDSITSPVISMNLNGLRAARGGWFNTETVNDAFSTMAEDTVLSAIVLEKTDAVFADVTFNNGDTIDWWSGRFSAFGVDVDPGNGTLLAKTKDNRPLFVRWAANDTFYVGAGHLPHGERAYIANGQDKYAPVTYFNFTPSVQTVFFNELKRMTGLLTNVNPISINKPQLSVYIMGNNLTVSMEGLRSVEIYSVTGKLLISEKINSSKVKLTNNLDSGIYIVRAYNKKGTAVAKKILVK